MSYELIETVEVGAGGVSSIDFDSIPQDATDLILKLSLRASSGVDIPCNLRFNSDTGSNYSSVFVEATGAGSSQDTFSNSGDDLFFARINATDSTADTFSSSSVHITNYTSTTNKLINIENAAESGTTTAFIQFARGTYNTSSAISSLSLFTTVNFVEGSLASLYKITAA